MKHLNRGSLRRGSEHLFDAFRKQIVLNNIDGLSATSVFSTGSRRETVIQQDSRSLVSSFSASYGRLVEHDRWCSKREVTRL